MTILFSDIVGFTTIAEALPPEHLIRLLAEYLEAMSGCIEASGGTVGKYIGDAIMVPHHKAEISRNEPPFPQPPSPSYRCK